MSISDLVQQSDPNDAARAALSAAKSILADTSAHDDAREQAQQLVDFAKNNDIAATLRGQRVHATDEAATPETAQHDTAHPDMELFFDGDDLVVKLGGYAANDLGVDFVANGTRIEVKTTGAEPHRVLQAIDVHRPIADSDLTTTVTDDGFHVVRVHHYQPEAKTAGRSWLGLRARRR